jgi:uncharacterized protein YjdB
MVGKASKGKFETDYDFYKFLFNSISHNDLLINEEDLDETITKLQFDQSYKKQTEVIIQRTEADLQSTTISFEKMAERLDNLSSIKSSKKKAFNDALSDNMTVYNVKGGKDDDGDLDMKSMKSRTSLKSRKKKKKK